jgi:hypothetical protein
MGPGVSETMQQVNTRKPSRIAPRQSAEQPHRRDARHVGVVGEGRAHDVELALDTEREEKDWTTPSPTRERELAWQQG